MIAFSLKFPLVNPLLFKPYVKIQIQTRQYNNNNNNNQYKVPTINFHIVFIQFFQISNLHLLNFSFKILKLFYLNPFKKYKVQTFNIQFDFRPVCQPLTFYLSKSYFNKITSLRFTFNLYWDKFFHHSPFSFNI